MLSGAPTCAVLAYSLDVMVKQVVVGILLLAGLAQVVAAAPQMSATTLDVTSYTPPSEWKRNETPDAAEYTISNEKMGVGASIVILRSIPAVGDARANFDAAWGQIVTAMTEAKAPTIAAAAIRDGWQVVRGTTKFKFQGRAATATVLTATRDGSYVIVMATTIGATYKKDVDRFFSSLRFAARTDAGAPASPTTPAATAMEISGAWGFSTGGAMGSGPYAAWLSDRREYAFDGKGNYTFLRRHNVDRDTDTSIIRERGTYTIAGDLLTLTPAKSEREIWSKVRSGPNAGAYEKLLRREKVALEKAAYRVAYTVYLDTQVPNLMLTSSAATQRDGNFNATTQYRLFRPDGAYYTAVPPTP
ncbi:MAG: hypothetical protein JWP01_4272 [Myxococcales bacterium]|nr:hypothetical protein [Myxococcales bacterium]